MPFTTWAAELARWKDALADRNVEAFFVSSTENSREMKVNYTRLENLQKFTEWLENKAANESLTDDEGYGGSSVSILMCQGGGS